MKNNSEQWRDIEGTVLATPIIDPLPPTREIAGEDGPIGVPWSKGALEKWETFRHDPTTTFWTSADIETAHDLIRLIDDEGGYITKEIAGEIRQRIDQLGLSPRGKRQLRIRIVPSAIARDGRPRITPKEKETLNNRLGRLRAV